MKTWCRCTTNGRTSERQKWKDKPSEVSKTNLVWADVPRWFCAWISTSYSASGSRPSNSRLVSGRWGSSLIIMSPRQCSRASPFFELTWQHTSPVTHVTRGAHPPRARFTKNQKKEFQRKFTIFKIKNYKESKFKFKFYKNVQRKKIFRSLKNTL